MWKIIPDDASCYSDSEPVELRELKQQLANNSCKCNLCVTHNLTSSLDFGSGCYDKEVQVKNSTGVLKRFPQTLYGTKSLTNANSFCKDVFCPGCYMAMNLIRCKEAKVLKDEESETKSEMFNSDKSTERTVIFAEKNTSTIESLGPNHSDLSLCDMMSGYSTDKSTSFTRYRKRNNEKVTFEEIPIQKAKIPAIARNCICMENFINTIRPPLAYDVMQF